MNLQIDSRKVKPGDIFFCIPGSSLDGHDFAEDAAKKGASIIVYQHDILFHQDGGTAYIKVEDTLAALNEAANSFFGFPSEKLKMFGVTGTNGKSSIAYLISEIYSKYAAPCSYMGTIGAKLGQDSNSEESNSSTEKRHNSYGVNLTTPGVLDIHRILSEMLHDGAEAASIEVSSHGLVQGRVDAIDFDYAIYTNLTPEHLDYFKDMDTYCDSKALFFKMLKPDAVAVINIDDNYGSRMIDACAGRVVTYGIDNDSNHTKDKVDYLATNIEYSFEGMEFDICYNEGEAKKSCHVKTNMHVTYNLYNLLAVAAVLHQAGLDINDVLSEFENVPSIPGRMDIIDEGQNFKVIVDYAHTDDSYNQLLRYVREEMPGVNRIITVFGAPGKRDKDNRKRYATWVGKYGDYSVLTQEDPRDEEPSEIAKEIASFFPDGYQYEFIEDRYDAIEAAIRMAEENDVVLVLGKGAENYQDRMNGKEFWMGDDVAARSILKTLIKL